MNCYNGKKYLQEALDSVINQTYKNWELIFWDNQSTDKSVNILSRSTGQGVILSSLTTMIGFGSLMVADHQGVYSLGLVLTLGVGCCLVASITVLPAMLKLCAAKGWEV
jgi:hypothetical protein